MMTNERQTTERVNVVVMPGLLGSQITSMERTQGREPIWLSISQIVAGHLDRLRLAAHELIETNRMIAIADRGEPGRFGAPELTILVRELCWSLGRMGKKHLATVLIGVGRDNLSVSDAVDSWIHGIKLAISGMMDASEPEKSTHALQETTFLLQIHASILHLMKRCGTKKSN